MGIINGIHLKAVCTSGELLYCLHVLIAYTYTNFCYMEIGFLGNPMEISDFEGSSIYRNM